MGCKFNYQFPFRLKWRWNLNCFNLIAIAKFDRNLSAGHVSHYFVCVCVCVKEAYLSDKYINRIQIFKLLISILTVFVCVCVYIMYMLYYTWITSKFVSTIGLVIVNFKFNQIKLRRITILIVFKFSIKHDLSITELQNITH